MGDIIRYIFLFLFGILGIFIGYLLAVRFKIKKMKKAYNNATDVADKRKKEFENKILDFLKDYKVITNKDVKNILGIQKIMAIKYLNYLEKQGVLKNIKEENGLKFYIKK